MWRRLWVFRTLNPGDSRFAPQRTIGLTDWTNERAKLQTFDGRLA